jgi:hypothetical protein
MKSWVIEKILKKNPSNPFNPNLRGIFFAQSCSHSPAMLSASELDDLFGFKSDSRFIDYTPSGTTLRPGIPEPSALANQPLHVILENAAIGLYSLNFDSFYSKIITYITDF